jgi:hypothetical protein
VERVAGPPAQPDQEGHRAGPGGEAGRLGVEANQRDVRSGMIWQAGDPVAIDGQADRLGLDPDVAAARALDPARIEGRREPFGPCLGRPCQLSPGRGRVAGTT